MAKAKTVKKVTKKTNDNLGFKLGDQKTVDTLKKADSQSGSYRLDYGNEINIFALVSPDFELIKEHWLTVNGETKRFACTVHETGSMSDIASRWGYDDCPVCLHAKAIFQAVPKESKDILDKKKRSLAMDITAKPKYVFLATKGDYTSSFRAGQKKITPFFNKDVVVRPFELSKHAYGLLEKEVMDNNFSPEDLVGMPINFVGTSGVEGKRKYSKIDTIVMYPKHRIRVPKNNSSDLSSLKKVLRKDMTVFLAKWEKEFPKMVAGISKKRKR